LHAAGGHGGSVGATSTGWKLPPENGKLNVTAVLMDAAGNVSNKVSDAETIDTTAASVTKDIQETSSVLSKVGFTANETGTYKLHLGSHVFTELPVGGKLPVSDTFMAKEIFFEHWDTAGNASLTYLVDAITEKPYTVTSNTTFVV